MARALRLLWLVLLCLSAPLMAQTIVEKLVTPGPLSNAHARLEAKCDSCHSSFQKTAQNSKCVGCHKGVGSDIASGTHFHGRFGPARKGQCKSCHSDHKGRGYAVIQLNRTGFNHNAYTDFPLSGAHARANCSSCHRGNDYRGRPKTCSGCHGPFDPHKGQLGSNCQKCHNTTAWKPAQGFNHAATRFPLTGAHRSVSCTACHAGQRWHPATTCISCHARDDAHKGSRGTNCASCHTTSTWRSATFDHATTGFPLVGAHASTSCAGCHGAGNANKHPTRDCYGCHARDDTHKGQNGTKCASCHNPRSWGQTSFDHDKMTSFPLKGAHRSVECQACHKQPPKVAKPPVTCFGCHVQDDTHKGGNGQDCARCHNTASWKAASFDHNKMTDFPLTGKHVGLQCQSCHTRPPNEVTLSVECGSCHTKDDAHRSKLGSDCARCHNTGGWPTGVRFDHDLTKFPLLGKHAQLECTACHADRTYTAKGTSCASCHADDHHKGALGTPSQCQACHTTFDWKAWRFDHDSQTKFPLTGRHQGLICSACHTRPGNPAEIGNQCVDCHRRRDPHRGGFGEDCQRCHVTSGFGQIQMPGRRPGGT